MDERDFMEWFIDAVVTSDLYWDVERDAILDEAVDKLVQAGKIRCTNDWRYERDA